MWLIVCLFVLEAIAIVIGNAITIVIFTRSQALRRRKHILIISLSIADLLVGLISIPMHVSMQVSAHVTLAQRIIYPIQDSIFGTASLLGLTVLAIERACATYFPVRHRTVRNSPYVLGIILTWLPALVVSIASYFTDTFTIVKGLTILTALLALLLAYFLIFYYINCKTQSTNHGIHRRNRKLTVTLAIVTVISLITWLPYQIVVIYVFVYYYPTTETFYWLRNAAKFLHYANSLANFVVYALRMRDFKREIQSYVRCCGCMNQVTPGGCGLEMRDLRGHQDSTGRTTELYAQDLSRNDAEKP